MRTGFKCSQCHLNHIGGGERTEYGEAYTQYKLLMTQTESLMDVGQASFNPKLNDMITVGGNFREEEVVTTKYSYSDNTGNHVVNSTNAPNIKESNLYINVELIKNYFDLYLDQNVSTGSSREMYGMLRNLPLNSYVKVGQTLLPYGIRLMDDDAFIRHMTDYTYSTTGLAAEVGLEPGPLSMTANLTNNRFSSVGSVVFRHFRVGGSYGGSWNNGSSKINSVHYTYGPFFGLNFGRLTMMGEAGFHYRHIGSCRLSHNLCPSNSRPFGVDFVPIQGVNV